MSVATLIVELLLALAKALGLASSASASHSDRATGAALQREEDMRHEESRVAAAARAGLDSSRVPAGPDAEDRDSPH